MGIFKYKCIDKQSNILEIGLGTGKATQPILETQCCLVGIEPGENMALESGNREKLFKGIHSAINNHGGIITVYYTLDLELARKP